MMVLQKEEIRAVVVPDMETRQPSCESYGSQLRPQNLGKRHFSALLGTMNNCSFYAFFPPSRIL